MSHSESDSISRSNASSVPGAEFERELIRARTGEGRKRAQARGVKFGRPPKLNAHQRKEAIARMRNDETQADIARTYGVDATTIGRLDCLPAQ